MIPIRRGIAFARTEHLELDASDLDSYLFDRVTRMDNAWDVSAPVPMGSDRIHSVSEPLSVIGPKRRKRCGRAQRPDAGGIQCLR
jgi:hypothetical protein